MSLQNIHTCTVVDIIINNFADENFDSYRGLENLLAIKSLNLGEYLIIHVQHRILCVI
jgi:hypothetical protein